MTLRLNGSSSGHTEIQAPAAAGSNTLILPTSNGSANQYLRNSDTAGTLEFGDLERVKRTYATEVTYSTGDTQIEFTGIPANFSRLLLVMRGVSLSGTNHFELEVGHAADSGTYLTTGYDSMSAALGTSTITGGVNTTSFVIRGGGGSVELGGYIELIPDRASSPNRLYSSHAMMNTGGTTMRYGAGVGPDISNVTIDRIRLTATGSNTFDNGNNAALSLITEVIE